MNRIPVYFLLFSLVLGCSSAKHNFDKNTRKVLKSEFYDNQFTGFLVVDAQNNDTLLNFNGKKYFTPASNTKIFTLFASLTLLPDSIPSLKYQILGDTLYAQGTGDPTQLHSFFEDSTAIELMKRHDNIHFTLNNFKDEKLGPGWSWDDYHYSYQVEKGPFPMYGNVTTIFPLETKKVVPSYFKDSVVLIRFGQNREWQKNLFFYDASRTDTLEVPFITDSSLTRNLLEKALGKKVKIVPNLPPGEMKILYGLPSDSIYKRMMRVSDNFLAEQLLILASSTLSDTLDGRKTIAYLLKNNLSNLKQPPRWVDGSGLSRYNLFSPESMVHVLHRMYDSIPRERLFNFFPVGGVSGTLEDWYPGNPEPYIYAKTGSLGNNHNLSGYLITKSGKTLIFSFMNNHFINASSEVKKRMQQIFEEIRDTY